MTFEQIEEQVKKDYVGKEYGTGWCGTASNAAAFVCIELQKIYGKNFGSKQSDVFRNDMLITYKDLAIARVKFTKQKGERYRDWDGYHYKWNIKDITLLKCNSNFGKPTIEEEMNAIDEYRHKEEEKKNDIETKAVEIFKYIKEHYNFDDDYKVRELIRHIDKNFYGIERKANAS